MKVAGDFRTLPRARTSPAGVSEDTADLNHTLGQSDLKDLYRPLGPTAGHTFLSRSPGMFTSTVRRPGPTTCLNKFERTDVIRGVCSRTTMEPNWKSVRERAGTSPQTTRFQSTQGSKKVP